MTYLIVKNHNIKAKTMKITCTVGATGLGWQIVHFCAKFGYSDLAKIFWVGFHLPGASTFKPRLLAANLKGSLTQTEDLMSSVLGQENKPSRLPIQAHQLNHCLV